MPVLLALSPKEQLGKWPNLSLKYTEAYGAPELRRLISETIYPELYDENILFFAGAEEAIYTCLNVVCDASSHVIVLTPCYQFLFEIPKNHAGSVTCIELEEKINGVLMLKKFQLKFKKTRHVW